MIDQTLTFTKFLNSVVDFLQERMKTAYDKKQYDDIKKAIAIVRTARDSLGKPGFDAHKMYDDLAGVPHDAFVKHNSQDFAALRCFTRTVYLISEYYHRPNNNKFEEVLKAIKEWNMRAATNGLQRLKLSFMSPERFAVQVNTTTR